MDAWPFPDKPPKPAKATTPAAKAADKPEPADPLYKKARALVIKTQQASKRLLKEELSIGQDKALALLAQLEAPLSDAQVSCGRCSEMQRDAARCSEMWLDAARCSEM